MPSYSLIGICSTGTGQRAGIELFFGYRRSSVPLHSLEARTGRYIDWPNCPLLAAGERFFGVNSISGSMAPESLQIVELAIARHKDMDNHIAIVLSAPSGLRSCLRCAAPAGRTGLLFRLSIELAIARTLHVRKARHNHKVVGQIRNIGRFLKW